MAEKFELIPTDGLGAEIVNAAVNGVKEVANEQAKEIAVSSKTKKELAENITALVKKTFAKAIEEAKKSSSKSVNDKVSLGDMSASFTYAKSRNKNDLVITFEEANQKVLELKASLKDLDGMINSLGNNNKAFLTQAENIANTLSGVDIGAHTIDTTGASKTSQTQAVNKLISERYDSLISKAKELVEEKREELQEVLQGMEIGTPIPTDTPEKVKEWLESVDWGDYLTSDIEGLGRTTSTLLLLKQALLNFSNSSAEVKSELTAFEQTFLAPEFSTTGADVFSNFVDDYEEQMKNIEAKVSSGDLKKLPTKISELLQSMSNSFLSSTFEREGHAFNADEIDSLESEYSNYIQEIDLFYKRLVNSAPSKDAEEVRSAIEKANKYNPFKDYAEVIDIYKQSEESLKLRLQEVTTTSEETSQVVAETQQKVVDPIARIIKLMDSLDSLAANQTSSNNAKKQFQSAVQELKSIFDTLKSGLSDVKPEELVKNVDSLKFLRNIWSKLEKYGQTVGKMNINGVEIKDFNQLNSVIKYLQNNSTDLAKAIEETRRAIHNTDALVDENGEEITEEYTDDNNSIAGKIAKEAELKAKKIEEENKALDEEKKKAEEIEKAAKKTKKSSKKKEDKTAVGAVAEQITEENKQLEQANKQTEQIIAQTEETQKKAESVAKKSKKTKTEPTPAQPANKVVSGQEAVDAVMRIANDKKKKDNDNGFTVNNVGAGKDLNIKGLVDTIQSKLSEQTFTVQKVSGAPNIQITNIKEQIEKSVNTSTDTVNKSIDNLQKKLTTLDDTKFEKLSKSFEDVIKQVNGFKDKLTELKTDIQSVTNDKSYGMPKVNADDNTVNSIKSYASAFSSLTSSLGKYDTKIKEWTEEGKSITLPMIDTESVAKAGENIDLLAEKSEKLAQSMQNIKSGLTDVKDLNKFVQNFNKAYDNNQSKQVANAAAEYENNIKNFSNQLGADKTKAWNLENKFKEGKTLSYSNDALGKNLTVYLKTLDMLEKRLQAFPERFEEIQTMYENVKNGYGKTIEEAMSLEEMFNATDYFSGVHAVADNQEYGKVYEEKFQAIADQFKVLHEQMSNASIPLEEVKTKYEELYQATLDLQESNSKYQQSLATIVKEIDGSKLEEQIQGKLSSQTLGDKAKGALQQALNDYHAIVERIKSGSVEIGEAAELWEKAQSILSGALLDSKNNAIAEKNVTKLENLYGKIQNIIATNSKMKYTSVGRQFQDLANEIAIAKNNLPTTEETNAIIQKFEQLRALMYETGNNGKSELQKISATISATFRRVFAGDVTYRLLMKIREVPRVVREIDSAMTDLKRVTTETSDVYDKFLTSAISKSKQLGATVTETIKATSSFGRLGYELNDAAQLAESALIYKNVGWLDIETATNDLVSAMKAFNIEAEDSLRIVDTFNILGNKFALTSADVGTGLKQSASALSVANNSFEESAAMITAITEITQDASSAGNALKTLSLRIRSTKAELSEMGEDAEGAATTTAKLRKQIKGITGVDILKNNNEFKSTYEIMQGIAAVWKDLSDTEQASVLESLAGKVRANQVAALLNNWSQAEKALDESLNSSGTALKENDLYLKSAEGRLSQLKATAQDLALDVFNSDELKAFLKVATDLLNVFTKMKDLAAPTLAGLAIAGTTFKNPSEGVGMRAINLLSGKSSGSLLQSQGYVSGSNFNFKKLDIEMSRYLAQNAANGITKGSEEYNNYLKSLIGNINGLNEAQQKQVLTTYQAISAGEKQTLGLKQMGISTVALTVKDYALAAAQTAVNAAIGMGIGLILQLVVKGITALVQAEEKARQAVLDSADALKEETDSIDDYKEKIKELKESLEEGNLTQKEAYEKREELITIQDEIIKKYGLEKESVDLLNNSIETTNALLDEQIEKKSRAWYKSNKTQIEEDEEKLFSKKEGSVGYLPSKEFTGKSELEEILKKYGMFFTPTGEGSVSVDYKDKSLYEQYKLLNDLIEELSNNPQFDNNEYVDKFIERLNQQLTKLNSEKFQAMLSEATEAVEPEILSNKEYSELYKTAQETVESYNTAIKEGNIEAAQEAISNVKELKIQTSNALKDENNLLMQEFFDALFNQVLGNNEQNVQYTMTDIDKKVFSKMYGDKNNTELKLLTTDEGAKGFLAPLQRYADSAGVSIEKLIDILADLGVIEKDLTVEIDKARPFKDIVEDIEDAQKAFTSFDNAIAKMTSGDRENAFLTTDELNTLLGYDDTLVDSVEKTAKGYKISAVKLTEARQEYFEKQREGIQANIESNETQIEAYRKTLEELEARQKANPNDKELNQKVDNVTQSIANHEKELKSYKLILNELRDPMIDFSSIVSTITSKTESLSSELTTMSEEQQQFGHITEATAAKFISSNRNWEEFIQLNKDGQYELNKNVEGYENLIAESVGYNEALAGMKNQYDRLLSKSSELQSALQVLAMSGQAGSEEFTDLQDELSLTETELAETGKEVSTLTLLFKMLFKSIGSSQALSTFNTDIKKLKHQLDMGEITKSQYYAQYEQAYNDFAANATEKDQDALDDAEVTNYQNKITEATDNFEKANKRIENSYKNGNITLEQLVAQRRSLIEQYYGANSLLGQTEDGYDKYLDLLQEVSDSETEIAQKSYDDRKKLIEQNTEDHIISIDQQIEELTKLNEEFYNPETGKLGKTREAVDNKIYENNLREIQDKIKSAFDYWTKEDERSKQMGIITAKEYWENQLALADKYLKDIPQFADEYREIQDAYNTTGQQEMYDEELKLVENAHSLRLKNDKQYWHDRHALAEKYYKNNKAFEKEWMAEDIAYRTEGMRAMYEEDVRLSENAYKRGEISLSAHIQNQINSWKVYYKDKAELREEDLAAQESIRDQYKNGVQEQINAVEALKGQQTQQLNDEIDLLEESKAEYERVAQEKEKAIDKEIRALQRQKDAIEKKKKVEEEDYELQKAMMNLYKASMSTRLVYTGGGWELRRDEQKYQDAIKDVDEKKKENQSKQLDTAIQALQDQKTAISDSTQDIVDQIDKDIVERQLAIKSLEAPFDNLIKILTAVMAQMSIENLDPAFLMQIMNSPAGKDAMEQYSQTMAWITSQNKKYAKIGNKAVNEYYSYYPNQKGYNFNTQGEYYTDKDGNRVLVNGKLQGNVSSSNYAVYAQATREALKVAQDSNTSANTKELLNNFIIDLQKSNMTNEEFMKWMDTLAADSNMTTEDWMKKFGLYDLMVTPFNMFDQLNGFVELGRALQGGTEEQTETTEEQPKDVLTTTQGIYSDTSNILKIISDFNKANPNLFVGTEGSKVSTTTDVKGNAGKIADTINNSPVFNINVTGNADKSIVSTMRKELTNAFNEYTDMLTGALGIAHQRQLTT